MSEIKHFFVNGQQYFTDYELNLSDLIKYFNYNSSLFIIEHNNLICNKNNWRKNFIQNADKIEIITIVGGG